VSLGFFPSTANKARTAAYVRQTSHEARGFGRSWGFSGKQMGYAAVNSTLPGSAIPKQLFGFEVLGYLGTGAGSEIYAVTDPKSRQIYALKYVVKTDAKSERYISQLEAEFEIGRAVVHSGLRRSIELWTNRTLFRKPTEAALILELFDGQPLETRPTSSLDSTLDCFIQVAHALDALNAAGYVHCDLKPNNILRASNGDVKVIDLGQSCKSGLVKERVQGTPDYISPEQVKCGPVTNRTDVFNFGATLYWALTGKNIPTLFRVAQKSNSFLIDDKIPSPRELNLGVPESLSNLVMECIRTSPSKRPDSLGIVARKLEVIQHHIRHITSGHPSGGQGRLPGAIPDAVPDDGADGERAACAVA
jgi:serine/threonine protein kinase